MLLPDLSDFNAVVYDLDGTLVDLQVDWDAATADVAKVLDDAGIETGSRGLWSMLDHAHEVGLGEAVEQTLETHERSGAHASRRLSPADYLLEDGVPSGVCSLNCERSCRIALDVHDLSSHVVAVVGRDTVTTRKPHPNPLLTTLDRMEVSPESAVFVGDSYRDEITADRAGVAFRYVGWRSIGVLDSITKTVLRQS